jgi:acetyl-CoA carboxylase biotin carboxylase subunit
VYSEADSRSPHLWHADYAVEIGPPPASQSYLNVERLLDAARKTGADAVHPGYGFLSERAHFAQAVEDAGLTFVGPPPSAIHAMGDKTEARRRMAAAGVPVVPGTRDPVKDVAAAKAAAAEVGYPVLLKAAAGGGGKGMRKVDEERGIASAFEQASSEAKSAFGDGTIYLEKYLERPRHVEIQVLADRYGHTLHLGERECSVQRRHQKLIEESPSPAVDLQLRLRMGEAAVQAARSVGYLGAGTVEFLLTSGGQFYFLEMNTRIQVEHPVTELVYGVDLVREQLRVAGGEPTSLPGRPLTPRGHAIECRITSEDPANGFLPATGRIEFLRLPSGPGIRWDGGIQAGTEIGLFYDPLLGKLIVWGETRERAIARMRRALQEMVIVGLPTSQSFHRAVLEEPEFLSGKYDIGYVERHGTILEESAPGESELEAMAVAAALAEDAVRGAAHPDGQAAEAAPGESAWLRVARERGLR